MADVTVHTQHEVRTKVDKIMNWSFEHDMPLSENYSFARRVPSTITRLRYARLCHEVRRQFHGPRCSTLVLRWLFRSLRGHSTKASRIAGAIRRAFLIKPYEIMWPAFQIYVLPVLMYALTAWNHVLKSDINVLESVQRRYTKSIKGMYDLTYLEPLNELNVLTVATQRVADMVFIFKYVHKLINCSAADLSIFPLASITRDSGCRLQQRRPNNKTCVNLIFFRAVSTWNKLP